LCLSGCRQKKQGPETKTVIMVKGDVVSSARENKAYLPVMEGQVLSNKEILTVADEASCAIFVAGDTLLIGGGSRVNLSSKFESDKLTLKVIIAAGRVFLVQRDAGAPFRQIILSSADVQAVTSSACVSIEKNNTATVFKVLSGAITVKSKRNQDTVSAATGQRVTVQADGKAVNLALIPDEDFVLLKRWVGQDRVNRMGGSSINHKKAAAAQPFNGSAKKAPRTEPLKASAGHNITALVNAKVKFSGKATCSACKIVRYEWDFDNDGTIDFTSDNSGDAEFVFSKPGIYNAVFEVSTDDGQSAQSTLKAEIRDKTKE
jgi:hypothetical protein